ncbi:hypothetical protein ACM39_00830 [Chryseobacterium sp. FH2]|uniref:hypothetical protein n=1 Tax=Chryseobacterium sp. FH2 TaxID=1674291 RepID=UPI00065AE0E6|nr:hypothetical protein [Chryseobacterium sp. FH2]KMQ69640.1 hypothetical protein ACM39_00830 [Chryseobacterium sp. FH2]
MRNKFILWLSLLIAFSVTFHSCRTDLEATGKHNEEKLGEHIHQKISTGTFQKETFLSGVNEFKRSNSSLSNKSSANSDYLKRFSIDETSIYKMDVNNIQTYALRAYNIFESPEIVYNLVYRKKGNDVAFSIVKILDNEIIPVYDSQKGIVTKIDNPSTARICTDFYSVEIWHCKEGVSWSQCDKCAQCLFTSSGYTSYECGGGGGGGGTSPGGGDTGGGGGGSGLYDPSGYIVDPNIPPSIEPSYVRAARASSFFYSQTDQTKSWAVEHADIYCNILEYYLDHIPPSSPPPNSYYQDFANFAIQVFMENPDLTWEQFYNQFINTPCERTKATLNKPNVKQGINNVKANAKLTLTNPKTGEIGFKEKKDGTVVPADISSTHQVVFNDVTDGYGGYHNHTATGIHMVSPPDMVDSLFGFASAQSVADGIGNAYLGMIAAEPCSSCPDGTKYVHYVIRYAGTGAELGSFVYSPAQMKKFNTKYAEKANDLSEPILYGTTYINSLGKLNEKGLEKLFFDTLTNMGLDNKVVLQRIEPNGAVYNVTKNSSGTITATLCP